MSSSGLICSEGWPIESQRFYIIFINYWEISDLSVGRLIDRLYIYIYIYIYILQSIICDVLSEEQKKRKNRTGTELSNAHGCWYNHIRTLRNFSTERRLEYKILCRCTKIQIPANLVKNITKIQIPANLVKNISKIQIPANLVENITKIQIPAILVR